MKSVASSASLFAGIGGFDLGFAKTGIEPVMLCERWEPAATVLRARFPGIPLHDDIRVLTHLPRCEIVTAGFPCTDLSQAGRMAGIDGPQSGLVRDVLRLIGNTSSLPEWLVVENVRNMLVLDRGRAMDVLVGGLEALRWRWAYRVVDARAFSLPQRRQRVILVASPVHDPREVLFADEVGEPGASWYRDDAHGFYWTEGRLGLGWVQDAIPTLKGGSTIGIPSPPAIWLPREELGKRIVLPDIEDGEALQGFPRGWTDEVEGSKRAGLRWKLVGNAVPIPVAEWVGNRLMTPAEPVGTVQGPLGSRWPVAAFGDRHGRWTVALSTWPVCATYQHLWDVLDHERITTLSVRAT